MKAKNDRFPPEDMRLAFWAKALSHPARIAILKILAAKDVCHCGELVTGLPLAQSTVSQHLKALKSSGLIQGEVDGPKSCYCVNWPVLERVIKDFAAIGKALEDFKDNRCC